MAKVYSWEVKKSPKTYAYIVSPKDYDLAYIGTELKGTNLQKVIDWASTCTDTEYEAQFNKMVALCEEKGYNVNFETVEAYIDVRSSCDNLRGPAGRGIDYISLTSTNNVTRENTYTIYYDDGETDTFTIQNGIDGRDGIDGKPGAKGDEGVSTRLIMIYTSGRDENGEIVKPLRPEGGSYDFLTNTATYPEGWDPNDSDKTPPIWMSSRVFGSTEASTDKNWSEPVQITGDNGAPGADGITTEFIFCLSNTKPTNVSSLPSLNQSGYCPEGYGWTPSPSGIDEDNHTEWYCIRNYDKEKSEWGSWIGPTMWSKYGVNGQDGDGVQYIYIKTENATPPKNPTPFGFNTSGSTYYSEYQDKDNEWIPKANTEYTNYKGDKVIYKPLEETAEGVTPAGVWSDNPVDVTNKFKYQWVSSRKYRSDESGKKYWTEFSNPALWGKFGDDGKSGTSIRKIYALSESTSNPPDLPGSSTVTGDWGTGFPKDYVAGKYVVWCSEAEIWAHNFEFVKSYQKVSTENEEGEIVAPSDYLNNFIEVDYIPDEKYNAYKYLKLSSDGHFYEWMGGWCEPYIITGLKGEDGNPIDYTTYVFGYGLADYEPQPPTGKTPDKPGASTDEVGTTIIWKDYPDTSEAFLDDEGNFIYNPDGSVVKKVDGYKDSKGRVWRWYQCCGHVDGRLKTVEWEAVFTCSGKDGETLPGKYVEFRFGVTIDDKIPTLNSIDINGEPIRNPLLHDKYGIERGWYTTSQQIVIPKGGAMYQIWATIDGATDKVELVNGIGWNGPIRVSGEKGEQGVAGPTGLRGVTGIPGAKMNVMYCLGTGDENGYFGGDIWEKGASIEEMEENGWLQAHNLPFSDCVDISDAKDLNIVAAAQGNEGRVIRLTTVTQETKNGSTFTTKKYDYYLVRKGTPKLLKENVLEDDEFYIYIWCTQGSDVWKNGVYEKYVEVVNYSDENNSKVVAELPKNRFEEYTYLICDNRYYVWESFNEGGEYVESKIEPTYIPSENVTEVDNLPEIKNNLYDFLLFNGKYYEWKAINGDEVEHKLEKIDWGTPFRLQGTNGLRGITGDRGQVIYPKGVYDSSEVYITTESKAPYVYDPNDGMFYVYDIVGEPWVGRLPGYNEETGKYDETVYESITNPDGTYKYSIDGTGNEFTWMTDQDGDTPANNYANAINENRKPAWVRFESFEALYTSIGIIANGLVGSAVFNNEFMFSQQGIDQDDKTTNYAIVSGEHTEYGFLSGYEYDKDGKEENGVIKHWKYRNTNSYIRDVDVNPYEKKNEKYIHTFMPNVCINFSTGQMWLSTGNISFGERKSNLYTRNEVDEFTEAINSQLENWADDGLINPSERKMLKIRYEEFLSESAKIKEQSVEVKMTESNEYKTFSGTCPKTADAFLYYTNEANVNKGDCIKIQNEDGNGIPGYKWIKQYYIDRQNLLNAINEKLNKDTETVAGNLATFSDGESTVLNYLINKKENIITQAGFVSTGTYSTLFAQEVNKGTGNVMTEAKVQAMIDEAGNSVVNISADKVNIGGDITLNEVVNIDKNGKTTLQDVIVKGSIASPFVLDDDTNNVDNLLHDNFALFTDNEDNINKTYTKNLKWTTDQSGRKITMVHHKWDGVKCKGRITLNTPSYFNILNYDSWERNGLDSTNKKFSNDNNIEYFEEYVCESYYASRSFFGSNQLFKFEIPKGLSQYTFYVLREAIYSDDTTPKEDCNYLVISDVNKDLNIPEYPYEIPTINSTGAKYIYENLSNYVQISFSGLDPTKTNVITISSLQIKTDSTVYVGRVLLPKTVNNVSYFYENGLALESITLSNEIVDLVGFGDENKFYGWIVNGRYDVETEKKYGNFLKVLAFGRITTARKNNEIGITRNSFISTYDKSPVSLVMLNEAGKYQFTFDKSWSDFIDSCIVLTSGYGKTATESRYCSAVHVPGARHKIQIDVYNNNSPAHGNFTFMIINQNIFNSILTFV